mgnify:FL=1
METESHLQSYKKVLDVYTVSVILTLPLKYKMDFLKS